MQAVEFWDLKSTHLEIAKDGELCSNLTIINHCPLVVLGLRSLEFSVSVAGTSGWWSHNSWEESHMGLIPLYICLIGTSHLSSISRLEAKSCVDHLC